MLHVSRVQNISNSQLTETRPSTRANAQVILKVIFDSNR